MTLPGLVSLISFLFQNGGMMKTGRRRMDEYPLEFNLLTEKDLPLITPVMKRAFDDDARKHLGHESGRSAGI